MGIRRSFVRRSSIILLSTVVSVPLAALKGIIVARLLADPDLIGLLGILTSFTAVFGVFATIGIPTAVTRYFAQYLGGERRNSVRLIQTSFALALLVSLAVGAVMFSSSWFLAVNVYKRPDLIPLLQVGAISVTLASLLGAINGALRGLQRMDAMGVLTILRGALAVVASLGLVLWLGVIGAAYAILASVGGALILAYLLFLRASRPLGLTYVKKPRWQSIRKVARFSLPLMVSGIVLYPTLLAVETFLALRLSFHDLGLYRIGFGFYSLLITVPGILAVPLMPMIAEMRERQPDRVNAVFSQILRLLMFVLLPLAVAISLSSNLLIRLLYGDAYIDADDVTALLVLAGLFASLSPVTSSLLLGSGRSLAVLFLDILWAAMFVSTALILINLGGLLGMGYAYLLVASSFVGIKLVFLGRTFGFSLRPFGAPLGLASVFLSLSVIIMIYTSTQQTLILALPLTGVAIILSLSMLSEEERNMLRSSIRDVFRRSS